MTVIDQAGLPISLNDAQARRDWAATVRAFLAHGAETPLRLEATLARAPDFAMGWATQGLFLVLLARRELEATAREALAQARAGRANAREAAYVEALAEALEGRLAAAADRLDAALRRWPEDSLALKLVHGLRFVLGDAAGMRRSAEAAAPAYAAHPHAGFAAGCRAFGLEETGDYAAAEAEGRMALALEREDAWGLHAVAHVFEMTGRAGDGAAFLESNAARWGHCGNFGFHVWWHLALFRIDRGEFDAALALYDAQVRAQRTDDYRDLANAASLLARLELEGAAVGERWEELAALAAARVEDGCNLFADLHYMLALTRTGRADEAARLAARIRRDAARGLSDVDRAAEAAAPAADALLAFARADWAAASARMERAARALRRIGGSWAQRDVFEQLRVDAAIRAGRPETAAAALAARAARRRGRDGVSSRRFAALSRPPRAAFAL